MADDTPTPAEQDLLALLGRAIEAADPLPDHVAAAAKGSFAWFGIDAELAALTFDSADGELVGARSAGTTERQLTFASPGVEVELSISSEGERRLIGQFVPATEATIVLETTHGSRDTVADHLGQFRFDDVQGPLLRLTIVAGATRVVTEWIIV